MIFPASITIIKDAVPDNAQDFAYTTTGGLVSSTFSLDDDSDPGTNNTRVFSRITTFDTYTITESAVAGWALSSTTRFVR